VGPSVRHGALGLKRAASGAGTYRRESRWEPPQVSRRGRWNDPVPRRTPAPAARHRAAVGTAPTADTASTGRRSNRREMAIAWSSRWPETGADRLSRSTTARLFPDGRRLRPIRVAFAHARNADLAEFTRFFGLPRLSHGLIRPGMQADPESRRRHREAEQLRDVSRGADALNVKVFVKHRQQGLHLK
jgi:hypothetical protein